MNLWDNHIDRGHPHTIFLLLGCWIRSSSLFLRQRSQAVATEAGSGSALSYLGGEDVLVLHWHGETFDLPDNAVHLASSQLYSNQAFSIGNTLALQFELHPQENPEVRLVGQKLL